MRHLVRNAPENQAFHPSHTTVSDHNDVRVYGIGCFDERISRVALGVVHLGRHPLAFGLGEHLRADVLRVVAKPALVACAVPGTSENPVVAAG